MREIVMQSRASGAPSCWHAGDVVWRYFLMTLRAEHARDIRLWEDAAGVTVGFAEFDPSNFTCDWQIQPEARWMGLEEQMLAWVQTRAADTPDNAPPSDGRGLYAGAFQDDPKRIACLERSGFHQVEGGYVHFSRSLLEPIPEAPLPAGFAIRAVAGKHEAARRAAVHRDAFHPSRVTDEGYARLMDLPGYDRDLDVVAVATNGEIAAFSLAWFDEVNRTAEFEPVGTRSAYRQRGLGQAVQLEGLRRMRAAGAQTAFVATWVDSEAAQALYQSVGFRIVNRELDFLKSL